MAPAFGGEPFVTRNPKIQIPGSKRIHNYLKFGTWDLGFGIYLDPGT
jgi:hypothetical protein